MPYLNFPRSQLNSVESICFVDWQVIRYASPATDFLYNLCGTTDTKIRTENFNDLKREYYDQLASNIRKMGSDPDSLFPYDAFEEELILTGNIALLMAPMNIEMALTDAKDVANLDEIYDNLANGKEQELVLTRGLGVEAQLEYEKRLNDCIRDFVGMGLFHKLRKND